MVVLSVHWFHHNPIAFVLSIPVFNITRDQPIARKEGEDYLIERLFKNPTLAGNDGSLKSKISRQRERGGNLIFHLKEVCPAL